jgi:hypothetical protein
MTLHKKILPTTDIENLRMYTQNAWRTKELKIGKWGEYPFSFHFLSKDSGQPYKMTFSLGMVPVPDKDEQKECLVVSCSCPGGQKKYLCKHVNAILEGCLHRIEISTSTEIRVITFLNLVYPFSYIHYVFEQFQKDRLSKYEVQ